MEGSGVVKRTWLDFASDPDHHAACPNGNPAITQQITSRFWQNFHDSSAVIQGTWHKNHDDEFLIATISLLPPHAEANNNQLHSHLAVIDYWSDMPSQGQMHDTDI